MKKSIVITTINKPNEVVELFSRIDGYELIVVGDKKTPKNWQYNNVTFIPIDMQNEISKNLHKILPFNHYCRKMIGYIYAIQNDSDIIIDTDDDNYPKNNWGFPNIKGNYLHITAEQGFINIYKLFTKGKIWPRGLPLHFINKDFDFENKLINEFSNIGIWQGLADGDPDVDAIYRLTKNDLCYFDDNEPIVLKKGTISPFNSQNTLFIKELFPLLYLPAFVTFRFTDILRSLVAQPIMWLYNYNLGFINATVIQKRNEHDYFDDFKSELPMYLQSEQVVDIVNKAITKSLTIEDNLVNAYKSLYESKIIIKKELLALEAWLKDIQK